jgi:hypothetical protein
MPRLQSLPLMRQVAESLGRFSRLHMTIQQIGLLDALTAAGWELAGTEELHEWWADDVWLMRSIWSPQEVQFHLTFLVDPQIDRHRRRQKGESVWAVKASTTLPTRWQNSDLEITLSLGCGWAERLSGFVSDVSRFRQHTKAS